MIKVLLCISQLDVRLNFKFLRNSSNNKDPLDKSSKIYSVSPSTKNNDTLFDFETLCSINVHWCATVACRCSSLYLILKFYICAFCRHHHRRRQYFHYVKCIKLFDSCSYSLLSHGWKYIYALSHTTMYTDV